MKIFPSSEVKRIDEYTILNEPIDSIDLMERAASVFVDWLLPRLNPFMHVVVVCGPGNNGGDGLAIARILAEKDYRVSAVILNFGSGRSADFEKNFSRLKEIPKFRIYETKEAFLPEPDEGSLVIIDAIFGSGLSRPAEGLPADMIRLINRSNALRIAVDIPSGLFGEDNRNNNPDTIIKAHHTLSFEFPFLSFFLPGNEVFCGNWEFRSIGLHPEAIQKTPTDFQVILGETVSSWLKPRGLFSHKGNFGHALLIAGKKGMAGAAVMAAKAALRTGSGLVTVHSAGINLPIIQTALPEAIVSADPTSDMISLLPDISGYSSLAYGPGTGTDAKSLRVLKNLLSEVTKPMVIDADGLNLLAANKDLLAMLPENTILTPHPGEFDRLTGPSDDSYTRLLKQKELSSTYSIIVVLKGAFTRISLPGGQCFINSTGNPGLAKGGSGDILTGMILAFLSQGYEPWQAAVTGAYLHGLCADLALEDQSQESLLPTDLLNYTGQAFKHLGMD